MPKESPATKELFRQLNDLLDVADNTFNTADDSTFPTELLGIPKLVGKFMRRIDRKLEDRVPFWPSVKALNTEKPMLRLIPRLTELVSRTEKMISPGPFVQLINAYRDGSLPESFEIC